jgi:hypothetical protein
LQRHTLWRRCQTSQQHTMVTTFLACIIHPLVTILAKMNRTSAFSEGNSKVQVMRPQDLETWRVAHYDAICVDQPFWSEVVHAVSSQQACPWVGIILHPTPLFLIGAGNFIINSGLNQGNLPRRKLRPYLDRVREMECLIPFLGSNRRYYPYQLVLSLTLQVARTCE